MLIAFFGPRLVEQHQRHPRGLAGAGRRHQHGGAVGAQRVGETRQRVVDREAIRKFAHALLLSPLTAREERQVAVYYFR